MNTLVHRLGAALPDNALKDWLRWLVFPVLFTGFGSHVVKIGPSHDKIVARITRFPLFRERLGQREIDGYLQHYEPKEGDIAVNAGGYHGYFAMYLSNKVGPTGHVYCFEPDTLNATIIKKNLNRNNCKNVTVIPKGLWNENTAMAFETRGSSSRRSDSGKAAKRASFCRLDDALKKRDVERINFISMDIEGAEIEALQGADETIKNSPDISIAIASYHVVDGAPTADRIEQGLRSLGLQTYTGFPRHLTTYGAATLK